MKDKAIKSFKEAVEKYSDAISEDYCSREGDDSVREPYRQKTIKLFKKIPEKNKTECLLFIFVNMTNPSSDRRFTHWCCELAHELVKELQKIKPQKRKSNGRKTSN